MSPNTDRSTSTGFGALVPVFAYLNSNKRFLLFNREKMDFTGRWRILTSAISELDEYWISDVHIGK